MRRTLIATLSLGLLAFVAMRCLVIVDETQFVVVTNFGRRVAVYNEGRDGSGLHLKWPWQSSLTIDRRNQLGEPPAREVITGDKRNLEVAPCLVWRVSDPEVFLRGAGTLESAEARLEERAAAALSDEIGRRPLEALASTDANAWQLDKITESIRATLDRSARAELGIEVRELRLRQLRHPLEVRPAVFDLIRSERQQVAATLRAEGDARYAALKAEADRRRDTILAEADAEVERLRGRAEAEAARLLNAAHGRDPKFYEFLQTLETYRALLDDKAVIVLSASSPLLRLLTQGPRPEAAPASAASGSAPLGSDRTAPASGEKP